MISSDVRYDHELVRGNASQCTRIVRTVRTMNVDDETPAAVSVSPNPANSRQT